MNWSILAGKMAEIGLPALGGLFGGPLGSTLGGVVGNSIAAALGVPPTPEAVAEKIDAEPSEVRVKLAQIEAETKAKEAEFADIANARSMEIVAVQSGSTIAWVPVAFSATNYLIMIGVVVCVAMGWLREDGIIVGFGLGLATAASQFWLGSSESSKRNADTVRSVATKAVTPSPTQVAREAIAAGKRR